MMRLATTIFCTLFLCVALVRAEVPVPPFEAYVTDLAQTLSTQQRTALEEELTSFADRRGAQVAVLLVLTTQPETIEQYALRVAEQWRLGRNGVDDGALLLVAMEDRALRIEVGYGLEGVIPDAIAKRIIEEVIAPPFKRGDYYAGVHAGTRQLLALIEGEPLPDFNAKAPGNANLDQLLPVIIIFGIFGGMALRHFFGRLPGAGTAGGIVSLLGWWIMGSLLAGLFIGMFVFLATFNQGRGGRYLPGGSGRRGGYGGGGFGGGRGGGFGGGGASGRW